MNLPIDNLQLLLDQARRPLVENVSTELETRIPTAFVPDGYNLESFENLLAEPTRKRGRISLTDVDSYIEFTQRHGLQGSCSHYVTVDYTKGTVKLVAVINDHSEDRAAWRDFTVTFEPPKSVEWLRWVGKDGSAQNQGEFAIFIEDNLGDIAKVDGMPTGTQMLELATQFEATSEKRIRSAVRLQSGGIKLEYVDTDDEGTQTRMQMFERFSLGIAPFFNGDHYRLDARLRYRQKDGRLSLWYELIRPDKVLEDAAKFLIARIKEETGFPVLFGNPGL